MSAKKNIIVDDDEEDVDVNKGEEEEELKEDKEEEPKTFSENDEEESDKFRYYIQLKKCTASKNFHFDYRINYLGQDNLISLNASIDLTIEKDKKISLKIDLTFLSPNENKTCEIEATIYYFSFSRNTFRYLSRKAQPISKDKKNEFDFAEVCSTSVLNSDKKDKTKPKVDAEAPLILQIKFEFIKKKPETESADKIKKVGINNEGNTCYMSCILQSIYNLPYLRNLIYSIDPSQDNLEGQEKNPKDNSVEVIPISPSSSSSSSSSKRTDNNENDKINEEKEITKNFITALQRILFELNTSKTKVKIKNLFHALKWDRHYWNSPQDAQEIYSLLYYKFSPFDPRISSACEGELRTQIEVLNDDKVNKYIDEKFLFVQLYIHQESPTLKHSLETFLSKEHLTGVNQYCYEKEGKKELVDAYKSYKFSKLPNILYIQLKRFTPDCTKLDDKVSYENELDLSDYVVDKKGDFIYSLYCVIVHRGDMKNGHYYCYIKDFNCDAWYEMNDEVVEAASQREVFYNNFGGKIKKVRVDKYKMCLKEKLIQNKTSAYILIYVKKDEISKLFKEEKLKEKKEFYPKEDLGKFTLFSKNTPKPKAENKADYIDIDIGVIEKGLSKGHLKSKLPAEFSSMNISGNSQNNLSFLSNKKPADSNLSINSSKRLIKEKETQFILGSKGNAAKSKRFPANELVMNASKKALAMSYTPLPKFNDQPPDKMNIRFFFIDNSTIRKLGMVKYTCVKSKDTKITSLKLMARCYEKLGDKAAFELNSIKLVKLTRLGYFLEIIDDEENIYDLLKEHYLGFINLVFYVLNVDQIIAMGSSLERKKIITVNLYRRDFQKIFEQYKNKKLEMEDIAYFEYPIVFFNQELVQKNKKASEAVIDGVSRVVGPLIEEKKIALVSKVHLITDSDDNIRTSQNAQYIKMKELDEADEKRLLKSNQELRNSVDRLIVEVDVTPIPQVSGGDTMDFGEQ